MRKWREGTLTWSSSILAPVYNSTPPSAKTFDAQESLLIRQSSVQRAFCECYTSSKGLNSYWFSKVLKSYLTSKARSLGQRINRFCLFVLFCFLVTSGSGTQLREWRCLLWKPRHLRSEAWTHVQVRGRHRTCNPSTPPWQDGVQR